MDPEKIVRRSPDGQLKQKVDTEPSGWLPGTGEAVRESKNEKIVERISKTAPKRVAMARHGLPMGGNESHGLQGAF